MATTAGRASAELPKQTPERRDTTENDAKTFKETSRQPDREI